MPLYKKARRLLTLLPKPPEDTAPIVPITDASRDAIFRKYVKKTGIENLTFHDTRHEALSRLGAKIANPMNLAKISGHKDLQTLMNVYYNPTDDYLADLLD